MKNFKALIGISVFVMISGCASKSEQPDLSEVAVVQFRKQMLEMAKKTIDNINYTNKIIYTKDPKSDWVSYLDVADSINNTINIGYADGTWSGPFLNLMDEITIRTGYSFVNVLSDKNVNNKIISIDGENIPAIKVLYIAYTRISHENIDLVIDPKSKKIILRPMCVDSFDCDGVYQH